MFLLLYLAVQWPFASFLMTPAAHTAFFNADNFVYWMSPSGVAWSHTWIPSDPASPSLLAQLGIAAVLGTASSFVGLWFGCWLTKVRR